MRILVTGGTGFVGQRLVKKLHAEGHEIVILTRNPDKARLKESTDATFHRWDGISEDVPPEALKGVQAVVNLMGENIANKRWSDAQKRKLEKSRIDATKKLVEAIENNCTEPLEVFISASATGYYPTNSGKVLDEDSQGGNGYLAKLCKDWEEATSGLTKAKRKIISRTGVILGPESGALNKLLFIFKTGTGGPIGNGSMMMSWIHVEDMVKAIYEWLTESKYNGIYNMVAPNPVSNKVFTKALAKAIRRPALFPVPPFMLKLIMGEMSTIVLDSQNIVPRRLLDDGFKFNHPDIEGAMMDLVGKETKEYRESVSKPA